MHAFDRQDDEDVSNLHLMEVAGVMLITCRVYIVTSCSDFTNTQSVT